MLLRFLFTLAIALQFALLAGPAYADVILLLSDNKPSVMGVAQAVQAALGNRAEVINLGGDRGSAAEKAAAAMASQKIQVIAVGLLAAQTARQHLSAKQVVFCQVLNYEDFDLTTGWMKGVSAIPSMQRQFQVWKTLSPGLRRVGVIASKQMRETIEEASVAARSNHFELVHLEVGSDREVMPALRRAAEQIQGLWIAPDSRVLSSAVIVEMVSFASRQNIQILGFSPALLREGALLSGTSDNAEIARLALARLRQARGMKEIPGEAVMPLSSANMSVNGALAVRLGLSVSEKTREAANVE
ncbi:hypothetical protein BH11PSE11_BH11PSE11_28620 [soil metagenome]